MLNRDVSRPYIYSAFSVACFAVGYFVFGAIGSLVAYGVGMMLAIFVLIQQIRKL
ncbi:hypothetical protein RMSM_06582 [Rhodopirellula maiorica SM1]|uniref:Uncharacterized protein n=1 Tax=Rhodopirellula maiorica SM1 TaxID=1265738 RepID=M5RAG1_9BACT|nr:hypothetical protein [Rhodopirellula maiorica]EMI16488.1 hypothetical protein RMSM_06582 [Rhodopirellula maiorica SM1]